MRLVRRRIPRALILTVLCVLSLTTCSLTYAGPYHTSCTREMTYLGLGGLLHLGGAIKASNNTAPTVVELENLEREDVPAFDRAYAGRCDPDVIVKRF